MSGITASNMMFYLESTEYQPAFDLTISVVELDLF